MPIIERDVVLQSKDADGNQTIDLPITRLANVEDAANVKITPENGDYLALVDSSDNGQMKKVPAEAFAKYTSDSGGMAAHINDTAKHLPSGGTTGYLLVKSSGNVVEWRPPMSNPNLLRNWYFADPINQRGKTEYTGENIYCIDGWYIHASGTVTVSDGFITLLGSLRQWIEDDEWLLGKECTFSVLTADGRLISGTATNVTTDGTGTWFYSSNDILLHAYTEISAIHKPLSFLIVTQSPMPIIATKLELGSQQTLAHQDAYGNWVLNDPPPNKALELLKCQRYFQLFGGSSVLNIIPGIVCVRGRLPVCMRTTPTVSLNVSSIVLYENGVSRTFTPTGSMGGVVFNDRVEFMNIAGEFDSTPSSWLGAVNTGDILQLSADL